MNKRIIIIDGNSLVNRAYYAMQNPMITKEGLYTQGVYGFINMLTKIQRDYPAEYMTVAFDKKAPTFRHKEYAEYKAGRKKMPPELAMQLPILKEVLEAMNIKLLEMEGFEADDIIGTVAKEAEKEGLKPLIITGDKDELQLATDMTSVLITKKGISQFEIYDKDAMIEKYGFTPEQFIDYKGLMGDQSDNIPGLPGVGEKTAQKLMLEYGSVEAVIENTDSMKAGKLKTTIEENAQLALMSKRLATINVNTPIDINMDEFLLEEPDYDKLIQIYTKLEFNSFLKKLSGSGIKAAEEKQEECFIDEKDIYVAEAFEEKDLAWLEDTDEKQLIVKILSDKNHIATPEIYGVCVMSTNRYMYVHGDNKELLEKMFRLIIEKHIKLAGHSIKDDLYIMMRTGYCVTEVGFDTAIAQYLLDPGRSNYSIKTMALEYCRRELEEEKDFFKSNGQMGMFDENRQNYKDYGLLWCRTVADLNKILEDKIKEESLEKVYSEIELPLISVMASMEEKGFTTDEAELKGLGEIITAQADKLSKDIIELAGEDFNINSPAQLGVILFEKLELPVIKKTKRGYSTNAEVLDKLKDKHPIIEMILSYRTLSKLNSTYVEGLLPLIGDDKKIRAHFQQTVTSTGRISCTEPNLQNIPIRQTFGRQIRKAFVPEDERWLLVGADYSQIELRVLAHMSGDDNLIAAFNAGEDIHRLTASKVLGVPEGDITLEQRSRAKAVNFGVIYGMSGFGLSSELHITRKEAEEYIKEYFNKYTAVKEFMDNQVEFCKKNGYVETIMGRKRNIKEINASNYMVRQLGERLAMNSPIQGSAADIIKIAMISVDRQLKKENLRSKLILQIHDELIIETLKEEQERVERLLRENMESAMDLKVKLAVDLNSGASWYDLK